MDNKIEYMTFEQGSEFSVDLMNGFNEKTLKDILVLEAACFSSEWQYPNATEYYREILEDTANINIIMRDGMQTVGYIMARSHNKEVEALKKDDPELREKENAFYIETLQILPEKRGMGGLKKLLIAVCGEAHKRGVDNFSVHARTINGLNDKIKMIFENKITVVRQIDSWKYAAGEPYEYIEWSL